MLKTFDRLANVIEISHLSIVEHDVSHSSDKDNE